MGLLFQAIISSGYIRQLITKYRETNLNYKFTIKERLSLEGTSGGHLVQPHAHTKKDQLQVRYVLYRREMACKTFCPLLLCKVGSYWFWWQSTCFCQVK